MNIANFNDAFPKRLTENVSEKHKFFLPDCPLFVTKSRDSVPGLNIPEVKQILNAEKILPYPAMRISFTPSEHDRSLGNNCQAYLRELNVESLGNSLLLIMTRIPPREFAKGIGGNISAVCYMNCSRAAAVDANALEATMTYYIGETVLQDYVAPKGARDAKFLKELLAVDCKQVFETLVQEIVLFISEIHNFPGRIVEVRPDRPGKSVQWTRSRTHYVLVHKTHPANKAGVRDGQRVEEDQRSIQRMAHSRRAHYRILRSPRFKKPFGHRIHVRATWVGPKEWRQGTSIYRIVDI